MRKKLVRIYFDEKLIDDIKLVALLEGSNLSFIVRTVVQDYINYYKYRSKKNDTIDE